MPVRETQKDTPVAAMLFVFFLCLCRGEIFAEFSFARSDLLEIICDLSMKYL